MRPQMPQVRSETSRSAPTTSAADPSGCFSAIPRPSIPGDHSLQIRGDVAGEATEQDLALLGGGVGRIADVARRAAFPGDPAPRPRLEGIAEGDRLRTLELAHQMRGQVEDH